MWPIATSDLNTLLDLIDAIKSWKASEPLKRPDDVETNYGDIALITKSFKDGTQRDLESKLSVFLDVTNMTREVFDAVSSSSREFLIV